MEEVLRAPGRNKYRDLPRGFLNLSAPVFAPKDFQSPRPIMAAWHFCLSHSLALFSGLNYKELQSPLWSIGIQLLRRGLFSVSVIFKIPAVMIEML